MFLDKVVGDLSQRTAEGLETTIAAAELAQVGDSRFAKYEQRALEYLHAYQKALSERRDSLQLREGFIFFGYRLAQNMTSHSKCLDNFVGVGLLGIGAGIVEALTCNYSSPATIKQSNFLIFAGFGAALFGYGTQKLTTFYTCCKLKREIADIYSASPEVWSRALNIIKEKSTRGRYG